MRTRGPRLILVAVPVVAGLLMRPAPAAASTGIGLGGGDIALVAGGLLLGGSTLILSVVATAENGAYISRGERAPIGWRVMGFTGGGLATIAGAIWVANASPNEGWPGGILLGVGAAFVGVALWASLLPEAVPRPTALVTPTVLRGPLGHVGYGLALSVAAF